MDRGPLAQVLAQKAERNSLHGSEARLMPISIDRGFADGCGRRPNGDAEEAASGQPDTSVRATPASRRWDRLARNL
jgi:hypothetical protein